MKTRRIFSLMLAALLVMSTSCGQGSGAASDETDLTELPETTAVSDLSLAEQRKLIDDELPDKKWEGEEFKIAVDDFCVSGFVSEELTGDVLSDAVFNRNQAIEERFGVDIVYSVEAWGDVTKTVQNSVMAGDDEYHLMAHHALASNTWVLADILVNWYDIPYVDFDKPWWSDTNMNDLTMNNVALLAVGDFSLTTIGRTYAIYFDKVFAADYQLPNLYDIVYEGKWTIDKLSELSRDVYTDLNQDGKRDTDDFYGYTTSVGSNIGAYLWSFGAKIIEKGELILDVGKTADIISKLITVTQVNEGTCYDPGYKNAAGNPHYIGAEKMAAGTTLFASAMIESGITYLRDANDYGILPYPKWDEAQSDYITILDGGFTTMSIPKTVQNLERSGIIAEALCAESYKNVIPDYYDIALKQKGARDEESVAMIDFIMSKRVCDFGYVYDNFKGFGFCIETLIKEGNANFASYYAANKDAKLAEYEKMFAIFENYGK